MAETSRPRTVLITGASSGLGAAMARALARRGHHLAIVARRGDRLEQVAREVQDQGASALVIVEDLADPDAPARIVARTVEYFGRLDALINNAGIGLPDYFGRSDPANLRMQLEVNFHAPIMLTRLALPHLIASKGVIISIGSAIVQIPNPMLGAYGATKAGLAYWSDALRREVAVQGVRVCMVELGPVETEFFDAVGRLGEESGRQVDHAPPGTVYNAMRDRPPAILSASVDETAQRIIRLVDTPRPRLAIRRRVVWPVRLMGAFFRIVPGLADLGISAMIRRIDREEAKARAAIAAARGESGGRRTGEGAHSGHRTP
ncbi:SDR family NAD(P)-dependent oxidoreductase [Tautonia rosea]|uniref:SDR family NAD(P)-dependent oxidoreductase n=1 Tax=Tautonia rosea TaxID=2728037 RepID=UPI0014761316|nr:SDR family NAD(P)-dependent oxidoreductase [Tautonia rosea]